MSKVIIIAEEHSQGSYLSYILGFVSSIALIVGAYLLVTHRTYAGQRLAIALLGLAVLQFGAQLIFFLHLGRESKPKWNIIIFGFMLLVVLIVALGTLWIMNHLNYHMMLSPHDMSTYMNSQNSL